MWFFTEYCDGSRLIEELEKLPKWGTFNSISRGYNSREELIEGEGIPDFPCSECGKQFRTNFYQKDELLARKVCFSCNFWLEYVDKKDDKNIFRIDGAHYAKGSETNDKDIFKGFGGREFWIEKDGELIKTTNLWFQGDIPAHFKDRLPDNDKFVTIPQPHGHGQGYLGNGAL